MSDQHLPAATAAVPASAPENAVRVKPVSEGFHVPRSWEVAAVTAGVMVVLALLGVGLTTASSAFAPTYWVALVPVYGLLCIATAFIHLRQDGGMERSAVLRQLLHWLGIGVALLLDFYIRGTGEESGLGAGLNALLLLAVGCYLAGVHLEWHFALVGVLLTVALVVVTKADQYLWLIFVVGVLTIIPMVGLMWLSATGRLGRRAGNAAHPGQPAPVVPSARMERP